MDPVLCVRPRGIDQETFALASDSVRYLGVPPDRRDGAAVGHEWGTREQAFRRPRSRVPLSTHCPEDYFAFLRVSEVWVKPHTVSFWRRPLTAATDAISEAGFLIDRLVEARPNPELEKRDPSSFQELSTAPCFIHLRLRPAQLDGSVAGLGGSPSQSTTD